MTPKYPVTFKHSVEQLYANGILKSCLGFPFRAYEDEYENISRDCFTIRSSLLGAGEMAYLVKGLLCKLKDLSLDFQCPSWWTELQKEPWSLFATSYS